MPDRDAFLRRVDERLPFVAEQRADVLEELRGHLDESVADLVDGGWDPVAAEEEALRRIGDPDDLAREIGRAQQTRRRLLAATGGAVFNLGLSVLYGAFVVMPASFVAVVVVGILGALGVLTDVRPYPTNSAPMQAVIMLTMAYVSGLMLPQSVARGAHRSLAWARRALTVTYVPLVTIWIVSGARGQLDPLTIVLYLLVPVSAWVAMRRATESVPRLMTRSVLWRYAAVVGLVFAVGTAVSPVRAFPETPYGYEIVEEPDKLGLGLVGSLTDPTIDLSQRSFLWRSAGAQLDPTPVGPKTWAAYPTRLLEVWPATDDGFRIHPDATRPLASAVVGPVAPPQDARLDLTVFGQRLLLFPREIQPRWRRYPVLGATIPYSTRAEWGPVWAVLVGVTEDGRRQVLEWGPRAEAPRFEGTILEWLRADRSPALSMPD